MSASSVMAQVLARLQTLSDVSVFFGEVPANVPANSSGRVYPYAVLWGSTGRDNTHGEDLTGDTDGAVVVPVRVTVAAGDPDWCLDAAERVRGLLSRWQPEGAERLRDDHTEPTMLEDKDVTPRRWFVPLEFRTAS